MAKIYSPKKSEYAMPKSVYYRMVYLVKDYPRLCEEAESILLATPPQTETPEIQRQRNITAQETQSLKYAAIMADVRDIEDALQVIPSDARMAILASIIQNKSYPLDRSNRTYSRYKQYYLYTLAKKRGLIS